MSLEENKKVVRQYYREVLMERNMAAMDDLFAPDFMAYPPLGPASNLQAFKRMVAVSLNAIPDIDIVIEDQLAEGDKVVTRWRGTGTHNGAFAGIPATGKRVMTSAIHIHRVVDGKIVALWEQFDLFGLLKQISPS